MIFKLIKMVGVTTIIIFFLMLVFTFLNYNKIKERLKEKNKSADKKDKRSPAKIEWVTILICIGFSLCIAARYRFFLLAKKCLYDKKWAQSIEVELPQFLQDGLGYIRKLFSFREKKGGGSRPNIKAKQTNEQMTQVQYDKPMLGGNGKKGKKSSSKGKSSPLERFKNKFAVKGDGGGQQARDSLKRTLAPTKLEQPYPIPGLNGRMLLLLIMIYIVYKWTMLLFSKKGKYLFGKTYLAKKGILDVLLMVPHIAIYGFILVAVLRNWRPLALLALLGDILLGLLIFVIKYRII